MLTSRTLTLPQTGGASATVLVGDVGGTNCRLALAQRDGQQVVFTQVRTYQGADFPTAEDAVEHFFTSIGRDAPVDAAVIAAAGPVSGGAVQSTNMHWRLSEESLRGRHAKRVRLINDFTALALSVEHLGPDDVKAIGPGAHGAADQTIAVIGAGTGFGVAALAKGEGGYVAVATEGGHLSFAPVDEGEIEILRVLMRRFGRVSLERLLSGSGLVNLRLAMADIEGRQADEMSSEEIVRQAHAGHGPSQRVVEQFCKIYGSVAGDLALAYGARGGVYLGGGIAPAIAPQLAHGGFRERFESKGRFRNYLAAVPTLIIVNTYAALIGAAILAFGKGRNEWVDQAETAGAR